jgi:hypothetical protein
MRCARPRVLSDEGGAVLAVVVLFSVAFLALGHGLVVSSTSTLRAARLSALHARLQAVADGAVLGAIEDGGGSWMDGLPAGDRAGESLSTHGPDSVSSVWRRLSAEAWLVEATAWSANGPPVGSNRMVWVLDPVESVKRSPAVVAIGPGGSTALAGSVRGDSVLVVRAPLQGSACTPWEVELSSAFPIGAVPPLAVVGTPSLGRLDFAHLISDVSVQVSGTGTPAPVESGGACTTQEPWNWGDPDRGYRPCGGHIPAIGSQGDLVVHGGVGQGLLVVDGDLEFRSDARFYGMIVATGTLRLLEAAHVEGFAIAFGGVEVDTGARLDGSACWAVRALAAQRSVVSHALPLHPARRLGSFR